MLASGTHRLPHICRTDALNAMAKSPQSVRRYLKGATLGELDAIAQKKQQWLEDVRREMPETLAKGCLGCQHNGHTLSLLVATQALASLMRFEAPRLLIAINKAHGTRLSKVSIRVSMDHRPPPAPAKPRRTVSPEVTAHLAACANGFPSEEIRDAYNRLRRTLEAKRNVDK